MNDHDPSDITPFLRFLTLVSGTKYDEQATRDARRRITDFFDTYLRPADD
jgi:carboxymethylenebutenolidase